MDLPEPVTAVCDRFLALVPDDLVSGLYLRGGLGFGEWFEQHSDVDFVATLAHPPSAGEVDRLRIAHEQLRAAYPTPYFSGEHVLVEDLRTDPRACRPVPTVLEGRFEDAGHLDELVTWHELAWHGVTVLGTPHTELGIWTDQQALADFTRDNLAGYWAGQAVGLARAVAEHDPSVAEDRVCAWFVPGPVRLHHLLVTGEMTSKSAAARWALEVYPREHHEVLHEALRIREARPSGPGSYAGDAMRRAADSLAVLEHAVAHGASTGESAG